MAVHLRNLLDGVLPEMRVHPLDKRVRGFFGDRLVVDSEDVVLVWEPRRYLPEYAVPANLVRGRKKITIKFQARPDRSVPGVYGIRMIRADERQ